MNFAKSILRYLELNNVKYVFGIPSGTASPLYDALNDVKIKHIISKNEGGASYMAARYASVTGDLGVCICSGSVGVNNMINGIADAMRAKSPVLVITGSVHRWQFGKGALQELDSEEILKPITKYSRTVVEERSLMKEISKAIKIANTVPKGPVHISIPIDILLSEGPSELPEVFEYNHIFPVEENLLNKAIKIISQEEDGIIMVGKGCRGKSEMIMKLSEHLKWPIVTTPEGKGIIPFDFPLNLGTYGFASTDASVNYIYSDKPTCLLVLGSSLGECSTVNFSSALFEGKKSIHIDWDKRELGKVYKTDVELNGDIEEIVPYFLEKLEARKDKSFERPVINEEVKSNHTGLSLKSFMEQLPLYMPKDTYYVSDLGEFMNFVFKYLPIPSEGNFEINLNYAAMGSGIAGAVGVKLAYPNRPVAVFAGDGCFFMNGMEIFTAKQYNLPIIYFIINNAMLGFVEHGHQYLFGRVVEGFKQQRTNISKMMKAVGIKSMQISSLDEMKNIDAFIKDIDGPVVIELITDGSEVSPNGDRLKALQRNNK